MTSTAHTFDEIACLVTSEVASRLDADEHYSIHWFNRRRASTSTIAEQDGQGGRRYRKRMAATSVWANVPGVLRTNVLCTGAFGAPKVSPIDHWVFSILAPCRVVGF
jgi:hypothetical protein